ncbi:MAG: hypothetical protein QW331_00275 [Candidatus Woesearchaeota archaeon]
MPVNRVLPGLSCFSGGACDRITAWVCAILGRVYGADLEYQRSKDPSIFRPVCESFEDYYGVRLSHIDFNLDVSAKRLLKIIEMEKRSSRKNGFVS